ncbi:MAG TPA: DsbA family oxidoreductase [Candidatus Agrococcus pullicola]|uniref:DsbA family oxidoreductase n=1 Tax=Candidatus Agrococcus pullicola TaxID=2838429 RepID=A0A9D1YV93_9MICO|nr:DsbA family oxidoreductase [Candidatus Agrococcus pullicola]
MAEQGEQQITIDLWTDVVCPWCYVGEGRLEEAIRAEELEDRVRIRVHSFELDSNAPVYSADAKSNIEHLRAKFSKGEEDVRAMEQHIAGLASEIGREYAVERPVANTRAIHRVAQSLRERGATEEFFFALQRDYFTGAVNPFEDDAILDAAERAGLDRAAAREILRDPDRHDDDVDRDVTRAQAMGASGVPFTVFNNKYAAPGALPVDTYRQALRQLVAELDAPETSGSEA